MNIRKSALLLPVLLFALACNKDEENPAPENEEEIITTIVLNFVKPGTTDTLKFTYKDVDGDGPGQAVKEDISLKKGTNYNLSIKFLNETDPNKIENLTKEIQDEGDEHQIFFQISPSALATHSYLDTDVNGRPVGIVNTFNTSSTVGTGTLSVTLKHQPDLKSATSTINTGATDIEQTFNLTLTE